MDKKRLHRPHGQFAFLGCTIDGETVYWTDDTESIQEFLNRMDAGVWIGHNLKFDITQLRRFANIQPRKLMWDTMLVSQIQYSGLYDTFSLADEARRRLGIYLPKEIREEFSQSDENLESLAGFTVEKSSEFGGSVGYDGQNVLGLPVGKKIDIRMTREQLEYACVDVVATWQVYQHQRAEIDETDLEIWKEIELPFLWTLLSMGGVKLDTEKWIALAEKNGKIAQDIQDKYGHLEEGETTFYKNGKEKKPKKTFVGINLNSPKQVKEMFSKMGLETDNTDVEALEGIANRHDSGYEAQEFAQDMLRYRTYAKRASTYGKKFIEDYVERDGKIYGDIFQMGTLTGRTSSRSPNLQNQPHDFEYRDCFIADDGNVMVVADWGAQEPRVAAYLSQDERLIEIMNSDKKLYIEIARDVFHKTITKQDVEYTHIKSTVLGIFYGMSAYGLARQLKIDEDEAQEMIDLILETYPGVQDYINQQKQSGEYVQSIYGRKIWLNKYNNGWLRDALNYPIQSSAADAMKIAAHLFVDSCDEYFWSINSPLRLLVHDEICLEVDKANEDWYKNLLKTCMIETAEAMHDGIRGSVEIFSGVSWGCKS